MHTSWQKMSSQKEEVILVNSANEVIGSADKFLAHQGKGMLHRAITVVLFNPQQQVLVTQRSAQKPLWPLWWDTACSTHQWPGESDVEAAIRRLPFEIGITTTDLQASHQYEYHAVYNEEWSENEINHIVVGTVQQDPVLNPDEVAQFAWKSLEEIRAELQNPNHQYAPWFEAALQPWFK